MTGARYLVGDVYERLAEIPTGTVDLVLTSPPFLALRSYLPPGHPDKAREIGAEATPADFLDTLLALTAEWRRVLAPHGSIAVELGDTYSGSGGRGGDYAEGGLREGQPGMDGSAVVRRRAAATERQAELMATHTDRTGDTKYTGQRLQDRRRSATNGNKNRDNAEGWPLDKSLTGIPTLYAWSLAYGRNLLTGEPSPAGRWRIRNVIAWVRPNPPVGALGDKFRPATSYMTVATVARDRYFDLDAVRTPHSPNTHAKVAKGSGPQANRGKAADDERRGGNYSTLAKTNDQHPAGAPPLDWWDLDQFDHDAWQIPTQPYRGSHYATWPSALCTRPILAMTPRRVCTTCGQPSRRITSAPTYQPSATYRGGSMLQGSERVAEGVNQWVGAEGASASVVRTVETVGWSDCGHDTWRPGHVLDPFAGSGTTLAVAVGNGRQATGIDLDLRNAVLAQERVGMWLEVDWPPAHLELPALPVGRGPYREWHTDQQAEVALTAITNAMHVGARQVERAPGQREARRPAPPVMAGQLGMLDAPVPDPTTHTTPTAEEATSHA